jgi:hypothetical protein
MNKKLASLAIIVLAIILVAAVYIYYDFNGEDEVDEEPEEPMVVDDRISPMLNQGLTVEILRIRNRGLMEKILYFGTSWKNPPTYYWVVEVDGEIGDPTGGVAAGGIASESVFTEWDTIGQERRVNYKVPDEQETSDVTITIMEKQRSGLFGRQETTIEKEKIFVTYDYRTGHWSGIDDRLGDEDGYGHLRGDEYEVWFNIYQSDMDMDGIPFWTEVNIYGFDPTIDDSFRDPDNDGIPSSWEWKWGYDPNSWDNHEFLDPDIDGIQNIEEYRFADYFADPFSPDMFIETDGMEKGKLFDWEHVFYKESQQMVIERFAGRGINVYIDDGWPDGPINGGGEMLGFVETIDEVVGGDMAGWYKHNFADDRKGVFRYVVVGYNAGFITPSEYNHYDHIVVDTSPYKTYFKRYAFTPRYQRVIEAKAVLHELGHSLGLMPWTFKGIDSMPGGNARWPDSLTDEEYQHFNTEYKSVMNYNYIFNVFSDRDFFDFSDGSNGEPYDLDDWGHIYLPCFFLNIEAYEEPIDESFDDFEIIDKNPEPVYKTWVYHENLTRDFEMELSSLKYDIDNAEKYYYRIYVKAEDKDLDDDLIDFRVYVEPELAPVYSVWTLIGEGKYNTEKDTLEYYNYDKIYMDLLETIAE